ncbi:MAG: aminotransferase class IV [Gemmataceae bacterium]
MNAPLAWLNGRFVPFHEAVLPLHDAGFVSGATVVDNARTYSRKLFRWAEHLARFRHDCETCFVPLEATDAELSEAADTLVKANASQGEVHVVTFATPGPLGVYTGEGNGPPTLGMVTYPVSESRYRPFFTEGAVLIPVPMTVLLPTVKHRSRMNWHVADHTAKRDSAVPHALAVNVIDGAIHETSIANVLAVSGGAVVSPPRDRVLHGISLKVTRELCGELGIGFREEPIYVDGPFTELMLCGTGLGLAGVKRLGDRVFDSPGPSTRRLIAAWSALTGGG